MYFRARPRLGANATAVNVGSTILSAAPATGPAAPFVAAAGAVVTAAGFLFGNKPGPGKIYQKQCEAAGFQWNPRQWTMTGNCVVNDWNDALALMLQAGDPRVCVSLIPTKPGICPTVCTQASGTPGKALPYSSSAAYAQSGGNCAPGGQQSAAVASFSEAIKNIPTWALALGAVGGVLLLKRMAG